MFVWFWDLRRIWDPETANDVKLKDRMEINSRKDTTKIPRPYIMQFEGLFLHFSHLIKVSIWKCYYCEKIIWIIVSDFGFRLCPNFLYSWWILQSIILKQHYRENRLHLNFLAKPFPIFPVHKVQLKKKTEHGWGRFSSFTSSAVTE